MAANTLFIGIGFEVQKVEAIPTEPWDFKVDAVVTERTIYKS